MRARLRSGDGAMLNAIAFRAAGKPLGKALIENRGRNVHAAGSLVDRPLARRGAGAVPADGCGGVEPVAR